jgi:ectoine hydroxylase-related dioxygenase (phytanoyl-CoA dioxygenase family)
MKAQIALGLINLKAGQISLHNDALLHGSEANNSNRRRCGVTMRFSPTNVKGDLKTWPFFETQLARGVDKYKLNPKINSCECKS